MKKYRVAIIGLGRMGSTICDEVRDYPVFVLPYSIAGACVASERLEIAAGADLLPEKRKAFCERWGSHPVYENYLEMIEKERPDMVAICTKGESHAALTVAVAKTGVPMVFCEKAMACSMQEADAARDAIKASGARFLTGVLRRWMDNYLEARRRIVAGDIGKPQTAVHYSATNLLHGHVHSVDTLMYLLGDPKAVTLWGELRPRDLRFKDRRLDKDPNAVFNIEFEGGLEGLTVPSGYYDFEVYGSEGVIRVANNGGHLSVRKRLRFSERYQPYMETMLPPQPIPKSATVRMLEDLVEAHEHGRPTTGDIDQVHHCTEILFAIAECHHLQAPRVALPVKNRDLYIFHV